MVKLKPFIQSIVLKTYFLFKKHLTMPNIIFIRTQIKYPMYQSISEISFVQQVLTIQYIEYYIYTILN